MSVREDRHDPLAWLSGDGGASGATGKPAAQSNAKGDADEHEVLGWLGDEASGPSDDATGPAAAAPEANPSAPGSAPAGDPVTLGERLTIESAAELRERLQTVLGDGASLRIDAHAVERVDTAGLQVLASLQKTLEARGGGLKWEGFSEEMLDALELAGMKRLLGLD